MYFFYFEESRTVRTFRVLSCVNFAEKFVLGFLTMGPSEILFLVIIFQNFLEGKKFENVGGG